jgi:phospholipid/cholesterol/gamma-HCH transport system ATP-binding protein
MIEVKSLSLSLSEQRVLHDVSFKLQDYENLIILGRSGSGKTVLIKTLMGFFKPEKGEVLIDGLNVYQKPFLNQSNLRHSFAMVFQNSALLDSFTVFQNIALPLYERGKTDYATALAKVKDCLRIVGLEEVLNKYPSELSGGMVKRVGIARALVYDPKYIIFDEPISGLDPITSTEILYYIKQIVRAVQATTIIITHDVRNLEEIGDKVLFLDEGEELFFGSLPDLKVSKEERIQEFLNI